MNRIYRISGIHIILTILLIFMFLPLLMKYVFFPLLVFGLGFYVISRIMKWLQSVSLFNKKAPAVVRLNDSEGIVIDVEARGG